MCHGSTGVIESTDPVPEHVPAFAFEAPVSLGEIELVYRVVRAQSPEQALATARIVYEIARPSPSHQLQVRTQAVQSSR